MFFKNKRSEGGAVGVVLIQFNKRFRPVAENVNKQRHLAFGRRGKLYHSFKKKCHRCSRLCVLSSQGAPSKCLAPYGTSLAELTIAT
jgi:hypothetical protein